MSGTVHRFGDDVSTDHITSGRHRFLAKDMSALAAHCLEDLHPGFAARVRPKSGCRNAGRLSRTLRRDGCETGSFAFFRSPARRARRMIQKMRMKA